MFMSVISRSTGSLARKPSAWVDEVKVVTSCPSPEQILPRRVTMGSSSSRIRVRIAVVPVQIGTAPRNLERIAPRRVPR